MSDINDRPLYKWHCPLCKQDENLDEDYNEYYDPADRYETCCDNEHLVKLYFDDDKERLEVISAAPFHHKDASR